MCAGTRLRGSRVAWFPGAVRLPAAALLAVAAWLLPAVCAGSEPPGLTIVASPEACPSPAQLAEAFTKFLPTHSLRDAPVGAGAIPVEVVDLGARYRVTVASAERQFLDSARRCEERAEAAAVFVSLTLDPPEEEDDDSGPPAAIAAQPPSAPSSSTVSQAHEVPSAPFVHLEAAAIFVAAPPAAQTALYSGGGSLRLAAGRRFIGAELGVTALAPSTIDLGGGPGTVRLLRLPIDAGVRLQKGWANADVVADLGLALTVVWVEGLDLPRNRDDATLDAGVRAAVGARWHAGRRLWPMLLVEAVVHSGSFLLKVDGVTVSEAPRWWLGVGAGIAWSAR